VRTKTKQVFGVLSKIKLRLYAQNANFLPEAGSNWGPVIGWVGKSQKKRAKYVDRTEMHSKGCQKFSNLWLQRKTDSESESAGL